MIRVIVGMVIVVTVLLYIHLSVEIIKMIIK